MSKWNVINAIAILFLAIGVIVNTIQLDYIGVFITFFLLVGMIFSIIFHRGKSSKLSDIYYQLSNFFMIMGFFGLVAKYFIY